MGEKEKDAEVVEVFGEDSMVLDISLVYISHGKRLHTYLPTHSTQEDGRPQ